MDKNISKRLKQIDIENKIWIIYLVIIALSYKANHLEKEYFITGNPKKKDYYRYLNISIFLVLLIVYLYFEKGVLEDFFNDKHNQYNKILLIASTCVLISGFLFLYVLIQDKNIQTEIAFN